jgi:hypothetical protein
VSKSIYFKNKNKKKKKGKKKKYLSHLTLVDGGCSWSEVDMQGVS